VTDLLSWAGISLVILAIVVYAYVGYRESQAKAKGATEKTALVDSVKAAPAGMGRSAEAATSKAALKLPLVTDKV